MPPQSSKEPPVPDPTTYDPELGSLPYDDPPEGNLGDRVARLERELAAANAKIVLMERVITATALPNSIWGGFLNERQLRKIRGYVFPLTRIGGITGLTRNALTKAGYTAVWQFCEESPEALLAKGLTEEQVDDIKTALSWYYVVLGEQISPF